jgi:hypothetical protein
MKKRSRLALPVLPVLAAFAAWSLPGCAATAAPPRAGFKASTTYLHLLAKTPFFTALTREQLQWVIDHSKEWRVNAGTEISSSAEAPDNFWVLLDGGWQVEFDGRYAPAGHADSAKWYGGDAFAALSGPSRLTATAQSYVMSIRNADLEAMRTQGFAFDQHLQDGMRFYRGFLVR